jgi:uncharacterized protein DUF6869
MVTRTPETAGPGSEFSIPLVPDETATRSSLVRRKPAGRLVPHPWPTGFVNAVSTGGAAIISGMEHCHDPSLVDGWWLHHRLATGGRDDRLELEHGETARAQQALHAYSSVQNIINADAQAALRLVLDLVDSASTDEDLAIVASGPLEDLINEHGDDLADDIDTTARQHPGFATALRAVDVEAGSLNADSVAHPRQWLTRG